MFIKIEDVLALKIKDRFREGDILAVCPVCSCKDSNFSLTQGIGHCWHCNTGFKIIDETGSFVFKPTPKIKKDVSGIRAFFAEMADIYSKLLPDNLKDYLITRGIKEETIEKYKLGYCPLDTWFDQYDLPVAEESGIIRSFHLILGNRITIPYIYKGVVVDIRGRVSPELQNEDTPNYMSLYGSYEERGSYYLYNHDIIKNASQVIITEGEFKALVAMQYDIPIVATPGIQRWTDSWTRQLQGKDIILAYDNELKINPPSLIQAKVMGEIFPNAKVAILDKPIDKKKIDIDEYIMTRGIDEFKDVLKGAIPVNKYIQIMAGRSFYV